MNKIELIGFFIVLVLIGLVICLAVGSRGVAPFDKFWQATHDWLMGANLSAMANPTSVITTVGGTLGTAGVATVVINGLKSKLTKSQTDLSQTTSKLSETSDQLELTAADKEALAAKLGDKDTLLAQKDQAISTAQTQASSYKEQLDKMTSRYNEVSRLTSAEVIGSLPGGTTITKPDGSVISVIEKKIVV